MIKLSQGETPLRMDSNSEDVEAQSRALYYVGFGSSAIKLTQNVKVTMVPKAQLKNKIKRPPVAQQQEIKELEMIGFDN